MGIQGLTKVLHEEAPSSIKEGEIKNYFGRTVAVDCRCVLFVVTLLCSMALYQFMARYNMSNIHDTDRHAERSGVVNRRTGGDDIVSVM